MTENELRQRLVSQAESWQGRHEADGSHRLIIDVYNAIAPLPRGCRMSYADPWCAAFVSAAGAAAGLGRIILPECSCEAMIALYRAAGRFEEADEAVPRPGDLIFYDWQDSGLGDCRGEADHVGIVASVDGDRLRVVEGNKSDAVGVRHINVNARTIRGYAKPDYASEETRSPSLPRVSEEPAKAADPLLPSSSSPSKGEPSMGAPKEKAPSACAVTLPILRRGDASEAVRAAQLLLIGRGWRCGPCGADGEFGPATYGAVCRFQRGRRLAVDGVLGPESWAALLTRS